MKSEAAIKEKLEYIKRKMYDELNRLRISMPEESSFMEGTVPGCSMVDGHGDNDCLRKYKVKKHYKSYKRIRVAAYRKYR